MTELRERFRGLGEDLDRVESPDLWDEARQREPRSSIGTGHPRTRKVLVIATAFALTIATTGIMILAFHHTGDDEPVSGSPRNWPTGSVPQLGLRFRYPPGWHPRPFGITMGGRSASGLVVSSFATQAIPYGNGLDSLRAFPASGVMFMLWQNEGGVYLNNASDDARLPLSLSGYHSIRPYVGGAEPNPLFRGFVEVGSQFATAVWIGPKASAADRADIAAVVRSVTFPPLQPFSIAPDSGAVVLGFASAYPVGSITAFAPSQLPSGSASTIGRVGFYLVHGTKGFYAVPMVAQAPHNGNQTCHVTPNKTDYTFLCQNGATWNRFVQAIHPPANGDEIHGYWLYASSATTSWDGHILVAGGNSPQSAIEAWPS